MKKILSMILVLSLALSMTTFAAETIAPAEGAGSQTVTATYAGTPAGAIAAVYYVTIAWTPGENSLTYTNNEVAYSWDASQLKYVQSNGDAVAANGWSGTAAYRVTVTNKSNATVYATPSVAGVNDITVSQTYTEGTANIWADNKLTLTSAAVTGDGTPLDPGVDTRGTPQEGSVTVTVGVTDGEINASGTVATISIALSHD